MQRTPSLEAHRRKTIRSLAAVLSAYAHQHHGAREPQPIAEVGSALLIGGTIEVILAAIDGGLVRSRDELIDDLAGLWMAVGNGAASIARARARAVRTEKPRADGA